MDVLPLVNALARYWVLRGRLGEARRFLTTALDTAGPAPTAARQNRPLDAVYQARSPSDTVRCVAPVASRSCVAARSGSVDWWRAVDEPSPELPSRV